MVIKTRGIFFPSDVTPTLDMTTLCSRDWLWRQHCHSFCTGCLLWARSWSIGIFRDIAVLLVHQCDQIVSTERSAVRMLIRKSSWSIAFLS